MVTCSAVLICNFPGGGGNSVLHELQRSVHRACIELRGIASQIRVMTKKVHDDELDEDAENDWVMNASIQCLKFI
jgi:hypothetical protein